MLRERRIQRNFKTSKDRLVMSLSAFGDVVTKIKRRALD